MIQKTKITSACQKIRLELITTKDMIKRINQFWDLTDGEDRKLLALSGTSCQGIGYYGLDAGGLELQKMNISRLASKADDPIA